NVASDDVSIELWMKALAMRLGSVLAKWPVCGHASFFSLRLENGKRAAEMEQDGAASNANDHLGNKVVNDGIFHHVALIRQTTNASLYIDGVLDISNSTPGITSISNNVDLLAGSGPCVGFGARQFLTGK